ncbi:MAG: purine nucleoside permease, partial [Verrucomicrobiae bacterium]|nr:purine nucleoside permease [Verrucomicrobiae bacterium]
CCRHGLCSLKSMNLRILTRSFLLLLPLLSCLPLSAKIPIKVLVVSCFEIGEDTGDIPGEFQFWAEREKLDGTLDVPGASHPLRFNDKGLYGIVPGFDGHLNVSATSNLIMALCLDPQLDLTKTYWLINGIAGIDPADGSIGSAVWSANVIDGDALREIDAREMPKSWSEGLFAIGTYEPGKLPEPVMGYTYSMNYPLNSMLAQWAYNQSKTVELFDTPEMASFRKQYSDFPEAQKPPFVLLGDTLGAARYWHGPMRTQWANDWVKLWTGGEGNFVTTAMEHQNYMAALTLMAGKGYLDLDRVMMLRTASNYCMPPPGQGVETTIGDESMGTLAAFEAAYRAGSVVIHELLENWDKYADAPPGGI